MTQEDRFTMKYYVLNDPCKIQHISSAAKKNYLAPHMTIVYGYQIIQWGDLMQNMFVPPKKKKKKKLFPATIYHL